MPQKTGKKAISPIIAIIILLLITISIAGAAYSYLSVYWESTTGENLALVDAYPIGNEANLIVRNTGTQDITLGEVKILDSTGQEVQGDWTSPEGIPITQLAPGKLAKFNTTCTGFCSYRISSGGGISMPIPVETGPPVIVCGNLSCDAGEDCSSCPGDCGCGSGYECIGGSCVETFFFPQDYVSYWKFDSETGGITPDETGNNNGTLMDNAQIINDAERGNVLSLDGVNDYVRVADTDSLNISDEMTISLWLYPKSEYVGYATHPINKWTGIADANFVLYYFGTTSGINKQVRFYANRGGSWGAISGSYTLDLNKWYHVVLSRTSVSGGQLYINGITQGSLTGTGALTTNSDVLDIGEDFNGTIDDVMIYNRSLNSSEILQIYNYQLTKCGNDSDNDSYGLGTDFIGCISSELDCNDSNPNIYPSEDADPHCNCDDLDGYVQGAEVCDNFDNDCDGSIDEENVCGAGVMSPIFSHYRYGTITSENKKESFALFDLMNKSGVTYIAINRLVSSTIIDELREMGYRITLGYDAGTHRNEIFYGEDDSKFLDAPCLDKDLCESWNNSYRNLNPAYTGILWQNTIENLENAVRNAKPEIVDIDSEIWYRPTSKEYYFDGGDNGSDCNCKVVEQSIGYDVYNQSWSQRGKDLNQAVRDGNPGASALFYSQTNGKARYYVDRYGEFNSKGGYWLNDTGGIPAPSLYYLPNLNVFEKNAQEGALNNSVAYISFTWYSPWTSEAYRQGFSYSNSSVYFDPSVSRKLGRILKRAGAIGAIEFRGIRLDWPLCEPPGMSYREYWLAHMGNLTQGYYEADSYVDSENDLINNDFEEFYRVTLGRYDNRDIILKRTRNLPLKWTWADTNKSYSEISYSETDATKPCYYPDLSYSEFKSGMVSWNHPRFGDAGNRTIESITFSPLNSEKYDLALWAKANQTATEYVNLNLSLIEISGAENITVFSSKYELNSLNWKRFRASGIVNKNKNYKIEIILEYPAIETQIFIDDIAFVPSFL